MGQQDVASFRAFDAVAVSGTNSYYSGRTSPKSGGGNAIGSDVSHAQFLAYQGSYTSTPNGTLSVEVSNASDDDILKGTDLWSVYTQVNSDGFTNGVATVTTGQINGSASFAIELVEFCYRRVRLKHANTSGSGTITALLTIKGI